VKKKPISNYLFSCTYTIVNGYEKIQIYYKLFRSKEIFISIMHLKLLFLKIYLWILNWNCTPKCIVYYIKYINFIYEIMNFISV
jgi:hypothetical protein